MGLEWVVAGVGKICKNMKICKTKVGKWVVSGRGSFRLVQNDQRNCRNVFKRVLAKDSLKKRWKHMIFRFFSRPPPPPPRRRPRRRPLSTPVCDISKRNRLFGVLCWGHMKIGKSWKMGWEWSGELQTGAK